MFTRNQNQKPEKSTDERRVSRVRALGLFLACLLAGTAAAAQGPDYSAASASVCIPYTNSAQNPVFTAQPQLTLGVATTVNGSLQTSPPLKVLMDTGSTGMLLSPGLIPNYSTLKSGGTPGFQFYSSSKRLSVGTWVPVTVIFYDQNGNEVATASVPVLGVEQHGVCPNYTIESGSSCPCTAGTSTCPCTDDPSSATCACPTTNVCPLPSTMGNNSITYMGVGFGQEADYMPQATPDKNPLLNLATISGKAVAGGALNPGYIIGGTGVTLGLIPQNTQGFNWISLSQYPPKPAPKIDWNPATMCVQVNGSDCNLAQGTLLADTGVSQVYITIPRSLTFNKQISANNPNLYVFGNGTSVAVNLATQPAPVVYGFQVNETPQGQADPQVIYSWVDEPNTPPFINTGRTFFQKYQFLYDAKNGYVGLKPQVPSCGG